MRVVPCVGLVVVCLLLTSCHSFGKKSPTAPATATRPTVDPNLPPRTERAGGEVPPAPPPPDPVSGASGILAGQVVDSYNRRPPPTYIEVALPGEAGGAPVEVAADSQGYFTIQGLQPGRNYQLTARAHDGQRLLAGATWATPPNPKLLIRISEDLATRHTPPLPPSPAWNRQPTQPSAPPSPAPPPVWPDATSTPPAGTGPAPAPATNVLPTPAAGTGTGAAPPRPRAAEIGTPIQVNPPAPVPLRPAAPPNLANIVRPDNDHLAHGPNPTISIPGAPLATSTAVTTPSEVVAAPWPTSPGAYAPQTAPSVLARSPVPFCQLTGFQLHNFALNDLNGQTWEFRQRRGRLVLLDFWGTWCIPCQAAIPHVRILKDRYEAWGLEVVGIAYEKGGTHIQQIQRVNQVAGRLRINYRLLLGGDVEQQCPVRTQFQVNTWPTLVLLDETGKIIWRSEGVDPQKWQDLELVIRQRLGVR